MKIKFLILFLLFISNLISSQNKQLEFETKIVEFFRQKNWNDKEITKDSLYSFEINENKGILKCSNLIDFETNKIILNPPNFYRNKDSITKIYDNNYPVSYSVIYNNCIISLFENGMFWCYKLETFERDLIFEEKLNNKKFEYHWIIDNKLGGISGNTIYIWNEKNWVKYKNVFPLKNQPKLFEDNEFIIIGDCLGEWGGTVYFFEKLLQ